MPQREISTRSVPKGRNKPQPQKVAVVPTEEMRLKAAAKLAAKLVAREAFKEHKKSVGRDYSREHKSIRAAGRDAKMSA